MPSKEKKFLIIDSNSVIHRAYHALPPLKNKEGEIVNAVYGFFSIFIKSIKDIDPECVIAAFDLPEPTFRHKEYKEYKAKRPPTPDELISQFSVVREGLKSLNVPVLQKKGFEADDIIGSVARIVSKRKGRKSVILSGDRDNLQLVGPTTAVCLLKKGIKDTAIYDIGKVKEDYQGLEPGQLIDFKALKGDQSDNIPGIPGIGEKTAFDLISRFGSLKNIYKEIEKGSIGVSLAVESKLSDNKDKALMSKNLVTIRTEIELEDFDIDNCCWGGFNPGLHFFEKMGFETLIKRIGKEEINNRKGNLSLF